MNLRKPWLIKLKAMLFLVIVLVGSTLLILLFISAYLFYYLYGSPTARLFQALDSNNLNQVVEQIKNGADPNMRDEILDTPLIVACFNGNYLESEFLLQHGAEINSSDSTKYTPLMYACQAMNFKLAQLLIDHGADVDAISERGVTAREIAVMSHHGDIVKLIDAKTKKK